MNKYMKIITWDNNQFLGSDSTFETKDSSMGFFLEIDNVLNIFDNPIPVIELCCGIGAIGISAYLRYPEINYFIGLDIDPISVRVCKYNIGYHNIEGYAKIWSAGLNVPYSQSGIVICNPPFIPHIDSDKNNKNIYSSNNGLSTAIKCFESLINTKHIVILKSLNWQVEIIENEMHKEFKLVRSSMCRLEANYIIAFSTWINR